MNGLLKFDEVQAIRHHYIT